MIQKHWVSQKGFKKNKAFILFIFFSLFFFCPYFTFALKKSSSSPYCLKVLKIFGAKSFYITNKSLKAKRVGQNRCVPLDASFELPNRVSIRLKLSSNSSVLVGGGSHVRVSKWDQNFLLQVSTGIFRVHLKRQKKTSREKRGQGVYIETNDVAVFFQNPVNRRIYDYIFKRTPSRTSIYSLKGVAFVSKNKDELKQKIYYSTLKNKEYTYGRLDRSLSFKKVRPLRKVDVFLSRFYKENPGFKKF